MNIKKLIKCFIPYGFLVLRARIKRVNEGIPFRNINFHTVKRNAEANYLYDTTIKRTMDSNDIVQICREDYDYPIYLRNNTSDIYVYKSIIEKNEYDFSLKIDPKYIIDAGANVGMASIYFAKKYKRAKIIAIEPEETNYELLKINTKNYPNITTINAALWNTSGEISLFDTGLDNYGFMVETNESALKSAKKDVKHLTKAITVDEIMHGFNIEFIDILKIDIEGAEKEVFESCKGWINKTGCIIIELHERMKKGCNKAFYKNIKYFDKIAIYGEDIYLSRENYLETNSKCEKE